MNTPKYRLAVDSFKTYIYANDEHNENEVILSGYMKEGFGKLIVELMNRNNTCKHENKVYTN